MKELNSYEEYSKYIDQLISKDRLEITQGRKDDQYKPNVDLVLGDFSKALLAVSEVGTLGAAKYDAHNWLKVENGINRYSSAMLRHYLQSKREDCDKDSGCLHLAHIAWNALAVLQLKLLEMNNNV